MTPEHLTRQVERLCERWPDTRVVGVHAARWRGDDSIAVNGETFPVRWCPSALAVSERLAALGDDDRLIVLTPLVDKDLGLDVLARLARRRLHHPERWQMVRDAYGVASVDPRLPMQPWMADALLGARPHRRRSPASVLDAGTAWTHVLAHHLDLSDGAPDAGTIIRWSIEPGAAERFAALPAPLAEAVRLRLGESAGGLGVLLAGGIAAGHASELLPIGLVCDLLFGDEDATPTTPSTPRADAGSPNPPEGAPVRSDARPGSPRGRRSAGMDGSLPPNGPHPGLVQAAARLEPLLGGASVAPARGREWAAAARRVFRGLPRERRGEWLRRAEGRLSHLKAEAFAERSSVLPSGLRGRLARFAAAATAAIDAPDALESAERAFRRVREHVACDDQRERVRHLEMALRLVRSLHPSCEAASAPAGLMAHHAAEGAFEDWARRHLLGGDEHPEVGALFGAIHRAVRVHREARNRAFAEGVREYLTGAGGPDVVPIEHCLARTVAPLGQSRPVLVLVLDGMDAGVFEEIGESLHERGWRRQRGPAPEAVLAVLPTVTESSRMALLSGSVKRGSAAAEKAAFARHPDLLGISRAARPPLLFHKAELTGGAAEGLAAPVREALRDERRRVVGAVLNAVDDHLAKSEQMQLAWRFDSIRLLPAILMEAHAAGRAVVLTSDHGHVLEAGGVKLPGDGEGRWRSAAAPATALEIEIGGARVRAATGLERIVLPWSETVRYGSKRNGYHGGVSLQEAVVPVGVYVGPGERLDGWEPAPVSYPPWWFAEEPDPAGFHLPVPGRKQAGTEAPRDPQRDLFTEAARSRSADATRWDPLFASEVYAAQRQLAGRGAPDDDTVRAALDALFEARGRLPIASLATRLDVPAPRMRSVIAGLQRLLNVDGYPVLRFSGGTEHVELDGDLFARQFNPET